MRHSVRNIYFFYINKIIHICLFFLLVIIPLIVNPTAMDYWYKPKIESVYALITIILIACTIRQVLFKNPVPFKKFPLTIPLLLYGFSSILSTFLSVSPELSIYGAMWREESVFTIFSYIALTFLFAHCIASKKQILTLLRGLLVSTFLISLYGFIQFMGFNPTEHFVPLYRSWNPVNSTMGNPNFLGKFIVLVIPLFLAHYFIVSGMVTKLCIATGTVLSICTLILTYTRASWLGFITVLVVFGLSLRNELLLQSKKKIFFLMLALVVSACMVLYVPVQLKGKTGDLMGAIKSRMDGLFDLQHGSGTATRLFVWNKAIEIIMERPFFGFGPDTHEKAMIKFNLEYNKRFNEWIILDRAHNNYLDIAIAQGLFGLASYLSIIITYFIWLWKAIRRETSKEYKIVFVALFSSLCGYVVNDFFIFSVVSVSPTFWSLMGLSFSIKRLSDEQSK